MFVLQGWLLFQEHCTQGVLRAGSLLWCEPHHHKHGSNLPPSYSLMLGAEIVISCCVVLSGSSGAVLVVYLRARQASTGQPSAPVSVTINISISQSVSWPQFSLLCLWLSWWFQAKTSFYVITFWWVAPRKPTSGTFWLNHASIGFFMLMYFCLTLSQSVFILNIISYFWF